MSDLGLPGTRIEAPPLRRRSHGLLIDAAPDIPDSDLEAGREEAGVTFCGVGCSVLDTLENQWCEEVTLPADASVAEEHIYASFAVLDRDQAPVWYDGDWRRGRIDQRFDVMTSAQLAGQLEDSTLTGNPSLVSSATDIVATAQAPEDVLYVVNELAADLDGAKMWLHSSPGVMELLVSEYSMEEDDGVWRTATGHVLVGDAGHAGAAPDCVEDDDGLGSWLYATLEVRKWVGPVRYIGTQTANLDGFPGVDFRDSSSMVATRPAIVAFDPCKVIAVKVDVPTFEVTDCGS